MDVNELANKILKAIGDDAQKRATLIGLLVSDVATKQDFAAILVELKKMMKTSNERFEAMNRMFEEQREDFHLSLRLSIEALNKSLTEKISAIGSRCGIMAERIIEQKVK